MIVAFDVDYRYPDGTDAVSGASVRISPGEILAILGHNGSGKTTLGKLLSGILKPTSGRVEIDGTDTRRMSLGRIGERVGYLFQDPGRQLFTSSVEEEVRFALDIQGIAEDRIRHRTEHMLDTFNLLDLRKSFPFDLSRGEKQRLALAAVMINEPDFLILDEPTTGLDVRRKSELSRLLIRTGDTGVGMMIISHDEEFARGHAHTVMEMDRGVLRRA